VDKLQSLLVSFSRRTLLHGVSKWVPGYRARRSLVTLEVRGFFPELERDVIQESGWQGWRKQHDTYEGRWKFYWSYDGSLIIHKIIFCLVWYNYHAHFNQVTADCSKEIDWRWSKLRISLVGILSPRTLTRTLWTSEITFPVISSIPGFIKWHF